MPVLLVSSNKEFINAFINSEVEKLRIPPSAIAHITPEKSIITIEQIRDAGVLAGKPGGPKILVIHDFSTTRKESQNAFLKALEESERCLIILCVEDESQVLPTIQSRTVVVRDSDNQFLAKKTPHMAIHMARTYEEWLSTSAKLDKQKALEAIMQTIHLLRKRIYTDIHKEPIAKALSDCLLTNITVQKNNLNHEYALDRIGFTLSQESLLPLVDDSRKDA